MIMKVLNKAMEVVDLQNMDDMLTTYQDFQKYMSGLFEKVYDQEWMHNFKTVAKNIIR